MATEQEEEEAEESAATLVQAPAVLVCTPTHYQDASTSFLFLFQLPLLIKLQDDYYG
jgi:hypothetical protein